MIIGLPVYLYKNECNSFNQTGRSVDIYNLLTIAKNIFTHCYNYEYTYNQCYL